MVNFVRVFFAECEFRHIKSNGVAFFVLFFMNENLWVAAVVGAFLYYHFKSRLKHTIRLTTVKTLLTTYSRYSWFPLILWVTIRFEYKIESLDQSHQYLTKMFNVATDDLAVKPYIPHKSLLQWICCKCLAW